MQELINPDFLNKLYIILAVGIGWIVLRLILRVARKIFAIGCFAIVIIGTILVGIQFFQGA
jgi:hypothetical protein